MPAHAFQRDGIAVIRPRSGNAFASAPRQRNHIAQSKLMRRVQNSRNRNAAGLILWSITKASGTTIPTFDA
jgi:hypothetical protein